MNTDDTDLKGKAIPESKKGLNPYSDTDSDSNPCYPCLYVASLRTLLTVWIGHS